jgi:coenzyme F420 biosynthesis associated uncharacterized protein
LIDLEMAARFAARIAAAGPLDRSYLLDDLEAHLADLVAEAEPLVALETGFIVDEPARSRILTRAEWASANINSLTTLLGPLLERVEERISATPVSGLVRAAYRPVLGFQIGTVLGLLSQKVLGQFDIVVADAKDVWFVGTNIVLTEKRLGFVPRDFRLWVALHELTHRAQFGAHPWLREHFLDRLHGLFDSMKLDARSFLQRLIEGLRHPEKAGPIGILDPEQMERFQELQAFMSVVEGHGSFVMNRIGERIIPTHPRMKKTMQARAAMGGAASRILRRLLGLDLKRLQYEEGQAFFQHLLSQRGPEAVAAVFSAAECLPSLDEIRSPDKWLARTRYPRNNLR